MQCHRAKLGLGLALFWASEELILYKISSFGKQSLPPKCWGPNPGRGGGRKPNNRQRASELRKSESVAGVNRKGCQFGLGGLPGGTWRLPHPTGWVVGAPAPPPVNSLRFTRTRTCVCAFPRPPLRTPHRRRQRGLLTSSNRAWWRPELLLPDVTCPPPLPRPRCCCHAGSTP
jgi:hypothetical protein